MKILRIFLFCLAALIFFPAGAANAQGVNGKASDAVKVTGSFEMSKAVIKMGRIDYYYGTWIPAYNVGKDVCIVAEDLANYGYTVNWDESNRLTTIKFEPGKSVTGSKSHIKESGNIYQSDVEILIDGAKMKSYNIGGYSLVPLRQLAENDQILIWRDYYEENQKLSLSGKVSLPNGQTAPQAGIAGNLVLYTYGYKGQPEKLMYVPFAIPAGQNSVSYKMDENTGKAAGEDFNVQEATATCADKFVGYEISPDSKYLDGKLFNEDGQPFENYSMLVKHMDDYSADQQNFDIEIFPRTVLSGSIKLEKPISTLSGGTREIMIKAVDANNLEEDYECISDIIEANQNDTTIPYSLDVIGNKAYLMEYEIKLYGIFPPRYGLWAGGSYPCIDNGYLGKDGTIVHEIKDAKVINADSAQISGVDVNVSLPEGAQLGIGTVSSTDISVRLEGEKINGINVEGNMAIFVEDMKGRGFDVEFDGQARKIYITKSAEASDKHSEIYSFKAEDENYPNYLGQIMYTEIQTYMEGSFVDSYNFNGKTVILVKDLKAAGLGVLFDGEKRIVDITAQ